MPADAFKSLTKKDPKFILKYMMEFAEASRQNPDIALVVPFSSIPKDRPDPYITVQDFGYLFAGDGRCRSNLLPDDKAMLSRLKKFHEKWDFSFDGYVSAGSSIVCACTSFSSFGHYAPNDIDMFPFYDPTQIVKIPIQEQVMEIYTRFLNEMTELCETMKEDKDNEDEEDKINTITMTRRTEYCTTVYCRKFSIDEFQMIHRAYSSEVAVVVGFDQMACKAFYDGEMTYFTVDAALCLYFGINPIDWRRESPNHLRRADKYADYNFSPIFPGLPFDIGKQIMATYNEKDNMLKSYLLPGCQLMPYGSQTHNQSRSYKGKNPPIGPSLKLICGYRTEPQPINNGDHEEHLIQERNETAGGNESDYDMEGGYVHDNMAYYYRGLAMLIKGKTDYIPVFSKTPIDILNNCTITPIRLVLDRVYSGAYSNFYFGDDNAYDIYGELCGLKLKHRAWGHSSFKILRGKEKEAALKLENRLEELIDERTEELTQMANEHLNTMRGQIRFITTNPGSQFTSSFHPIVRRNAKEYWGSHYTGFDCSDFSNIKFTILCIRRYRPSVWTNMDTNVVKMIFGYLYLYHFNYLASQPQIQDTLFELVYTRRPAFICDHNLLPWIVTVCDCKPDTEEIHVNNIVDQIE